MRQVVDFFRQDGHGGLGLLNACSKFTAVTPPPPDALTLLMPTALLGVDLVTKFALGVDRQCRHHQLHAARFAGPVLSVTMLTKVSPLPVAARISLLIEEAHVSVGDQGLS